MATNASLNNTAGGLGKIGDLHQRSLDENESKVHIYAQWAQDYDEDVRLAKYAAPAAVARSAMQHMDPLKDVEHPMKVLDAGCGTGLVGEELLKAANISGIDLQVLGSDISPDMMSLAMERGYSDCRVEDLNKSTSYPSHKFDVATCVGTFIQGHVGPSPLLYELCRCVKSGGVVLATVRATIFAENARFPQVLEDLGRRGHTVEIEDFQYLEGVVAKLVKIEVKHSASRD